MTGQLRHELPSGQRQELLAILKSRFEKNANRHKGLKWESVQGKLATNPANFGR